MTLGSFGCMCDEKYLDYKIHLHGYAARYARGKVWGENQKITADKKHPEDGGIILSFRTNQLMCVQRWVWKSSITTSKKTRKQTNANNGNYI